MRRRGIDKDATRLLREVQRALGRMNQLSKAHIICNQSLYNALLEVEYQLTKPALCYTQPAVANALTKILSPSEKAEASAIMKGER